MTEFSYNHITLSQKYIVSVQIINYNVVHIKHTVPHYLCFDNKKLTISDSTSQYTYNIIRSTHITY